MSNFNFSGVTAENLVATEQVDTCIPTHGVITNIGTASSKNVIPIRGMATPRAWTIVGSARSNIDNNPVVFTVSSVDTVTPTSFEVTTSALGNAMLFNYTAVIAPYYTSGVTKKRAYIFITITTDGFEVARARFATDTINDYSEDLLFTVSNTRAHTTVPPQPHPHVIY